MMKSPSYPRYAWAMNQVTPEQMAQLYRLKEETGVPITHWVAHAIERFLQEVAENGERNKLENHANLEIA